MSILFHANILRKLICLTRKKKKCNKRMNIGNRVRQLRRAKNMKIADLAETIGVDAANISRPETGKQKQFTEQALSNIAEGA